MLHNVILVLEEDEWVQLGKMEDRTSAYKKRCLGISHFSREVVGLFRTSLRGDTCPQTRRWRATYSIAVSRAYPIGDLQKIIRGEIDANRNT